MSSQHSRGLPAWRPRPERELKLTWSEAGGRLRAAKQTVGGADLPWGGPPSLLRELRGWQDQTPLGRIKFRNKIPYREEGGRVPLPDVLPV